MAFFESRSGRIFIETEGHGEPIMLIPGLGMDRTYYRLATPFLVRDFEVHAIDPRGIGQSEKRTV